MKKSILIINVLMCFFILFGCNDTQSSIIKAEALDHLSEIDSNNQFVVGETIYLYHDTVEGSKISDRSYIYQKAPYYLYHDYPFDEPDQLIVASENEYQTIELIDAQFDTNRMFAVIGSRMMENQIPYDRLSAYDALFASSSFKRADASSYETNITFAQALEIEPRYFNRFIDYYDFMADVDLELIDVNIDIQIFLEESYQLTIDFTVEESYNNDYHFMIYYSVEVAEFEPIDYLSNSYIYIESESFYQAHQINILDTLYIPEGDYESYIKVYLEAGQYVLVNESGSSFISKIWNQNLNPSYAHISIYNNVDVPLLRTMVVSESGDYYLRLAKSDMNEAIMHLEKMNYDTLMSTDINEMTIGVKNINIEGLYDAVGFVNHEVSNVTVSIMVETNTLYFYIPYMNTGLYEMIQVDDTLTFNLAPTDTFYVSGDF